MVWTKRWEATSDGDYADALNWARITLRSAAYQWTASGSGTNEYYAELAGGGDPGFTAQPDYVQINGSNATEGTAGSLAAGEWDYADNDTLGFSTVYVRLSDGTDPDSKALDYVTYRQYPRATDHVRIPAGTAAITESLDQSAVAIGDFIVEPGYSGYFGSSTAYFRIDPNYFRFEGEGQTASYIDLFTAAISPEVHNTASAAAGQRGLYLLGSAISTLNVVKGKVGFAWRAGETGTATTARVGFKTSRAGDASLWIGSGVTLTTFQQTGGDNVLACAATTVQTYGGILTTIEDGAITTMTASGGTIYPGSTGTITTLNAEKGVVVDFTRSTASRTVTTLKENYSDIRFDPAVVTITNKSNPDDGPIKRVVTPL